MRLTTAVAGSVVVAALAAGAAPTPAAAGPNDVVLGRLALLVDEGGTQHAIGQNLELRGLVSELGVALAPRLLTPSDTLGWGGFQFTTDMSWTSITGDATYWRARRSALDPSATGPMDQGLSMLPTLGVFARKGIWLPLPSIEIGVGMVHLMDSRLWAGQGYLKLALHEGYDQLPLPSVAVRAGVSRLIGQKDLDLSIVSIDGSVSKHFGVAGTWAVDPFAGYDVLVMIPRSEVIDPTPQIDPLDPTMPDDRLLDFVFKDQDDIVRNRLFLGAKLQYYVFEFTVEADLALAGSSVDNRSGSTPCTLQSMTTSCDSKDPAGSQRTFTVSGGFDF